MSTIENRALTYSLLAHIRGKGQLTTGPISIFVPLIKWILSRLNANGIFNGKSIYEIKTEADNIYGVDFPIPVLRTILSVISKEINTNEETHFLLHQDDAFQIKNYAFTEFEETIRLQNLEIHNLEKLFKQFQSTIGGTNDNHHSILDFIEKSKLSLSKYLAHSSRETGNDNTVEAQFVEFFKQIPPVYDIIRKIYLGSILAGYIEYKTENIKTDIELLLDTNFILGFLDLNTPESTHTCRKIIQIAQTQGYKLTVLKDTLQETKALLHAKADSYNLSFLQKKIYPEDIFNACDRKNLNKADLERISDNLEAEMSSFGVGIIYDATKYKNQAKFSQEYEILKRHRYSDLAALHDATAIYYVRDKRKTKIKEFENVNCWFINNSVSRDKYGVISKTNTIEFQPEVIKADDFLNIIWLSNPQAALNIDVDEISEIGLTSLISSGLTSSLPKLSIIRELDENIQKYSEEGLISDIDIVRVATRITTKQLTDIENLNRLASENKELFVQRLNEEAKKQKEIEEERLKKLDSIFTEFSQKSESVAKLKAEFENKIKTVDEQLHETTSERERKDKKIQDLENELSNERIQRKKEKDRSRDEKIEMFIDEAVRKWRKKTDNELYLSLMAFGLGLLFLLWSSNWSIQEAITLYSRLHANLIFSSLLAIVGLFFTAVILRKWYDKRYNHSNIENFKKSIKLPEQLKYPE